MAEGLSPAEQGPAPAAPALPEVLSGAAGGAVPHLSLYAVEVPPAGRRQIYPIYPQLFIKLNFDLTLPAAGRRGDDMVLCFDNGGEVVFRDFVGVAETHPTLHLLPPDGSLLPGDALAAVLIELGDAPALPSDDGLAAAQPEAARPEPADLQPALPEPAADGPAWTAAPPAGETPPGPAPTKPRPAPLGAAPEPDFPVQEILQDLEAQGVVPAAAPEPVAAAGSAVDLVHQVASALPDLAAAAEAASTAPPAPAEPPATAWPEPGVPAFEASEADSPGAADAAETPAVLPLETMVASDGELTEPAPAAEVQEAPQAAAWQDEALAAGTGLPVTGSPATAFPQEMETENGGLPATTPPPLAAAPELPAATVAPDPLPQAPPLETPETDLGQDQTAVVAPEMIGADVEAPWDGAEAPVEAFTGTEAAPSPEPPRYEATEDVPGPEEVPAADLLAGESGPAPEDAPLIPDPLAWPAAAPLEPAASVPAEPLPGAAPLEVEAEAGVQTWTETWAGVVAEPEPAPKGATAADPLPPEACAPEVPAAPPAESTVAAPEPAPWPEPTPVAEAPELPPAIPEAPAPETPAPEGVPWQPEESWPAADAEADAPAEAPLAPLQATEPLALSAAIEPEDVAPAAAPAPSDLETEPPADAPDAVLPGIAVPDFAALAAQAGLDLPNGPDADSGSDPVVDSEAAPSAAPEAGRVAPMELFESPEGALPLPIPEAGPEAPGAPALADPQDAAPESAAPEVGTDPGAEESAVSGPSASILRTAMASVLRAGNRILPSRGGEAEEVAAMMAEAQAVSAVTRSVLDEEEVLELTQPAEMPLPAPPITLPESAGALPPLLEEGKAPAQDLDAIELFSDPLSYGAGVMESHVAKPPAPPPVARDSGAGRRLGPQEPVPAAVRDAVRLALHQMDEGDLFDFGAEEEDAGQDAAATPAEPRALPGAPEQGELSET